MTDRDKTFPLKRYYLVNAGIGAILFYVLLFFLFVQAERKSLYEQYTGHLLQKATSLYQDVDRDFLIPNNFTIEDSRILTPPYRKEFRKEMEQVVKSDFAISKVKMFNRHGIILYDHTQKEKEGTVYAAKDEPRFRTAISGKVAYGIEVDPGGKRFMELYLPLRKPDSMEIMGVLEVYEDVSRFEAQVMDALERALLFPTVVFIIFNFVLYLMVSKADGIIQKNAKRMMEIRKNMEKYLSSSAVDAICDAVSGNKDLFQGEKRRIVVLFSDIRGFTSFSEKREPEMIVETLNRLFEIQAEIVHRFGGIIDKFVGDEIMVIFPDGAENHAVAAAKEIVVVIDSTPEISVQVGIGIHSGIAVVGTLGARSRRDFSAIGDTVNTSARLCSEAGSGEIVISTPVFKGIDENSQSEFIHEKEVNLKGKTNPFKVFVRPNPESG